MQAQTIARNQVPVAKGKIRITLTLDKALVDKIDGWRAEQRPIPTQSQAVAELVRQTLERSHREQKKIGKGEN
jgi:metal-responsive CopG/Arc/MetJ family transcriptional regulator